MARLNAARTLCCVLPGPIDLDSSATMARSDETTVLVSDVNCDDSDGLFRLWPPKSASRPVPRELLDLLLLLIEGEAGVGAKVDDVGEAGECA